jgi:hypothetical protein
MQMPQFRAPYQMAVCSMDVLPQLTKDQHILLLKTRQPMQARKHVYSKVKCCSRMIVTRVRTVHKFAGDMKATRLKEERSRQSKT